MAKIEVPIHVDGIEIIEQLIKEGKWVAVVRCKDCIHLKVHGMEAECGAGLLGIVNASDYCSHAIRKNSEVEENE